MKNRSHRSVLRAAHSCSAAALLLSLGVLLHSERALAFSDPANFYLSPVAAGGGGRFFTGSPADGYTCKSCHAGGPEPRASVLGLPLAGYKPGARYEVTIRWPEDLKKISLALELTDENGKVAGSLQLPPEDEIKTEEFCDPASDAILAAQLNEMVPGRQIINVPDCGSKRVRFLWTAPTSDVGPVWFSGSMVQSDGETDPYHDGVTDFGRIIGSPAVASKTNGECSVSAPGAARPARWCAALFGLIGLAWFRARRRAAQSGRHSVHAR